MAMSTVSSVIGTHQRSRWRHVSRSSPLGRVVHVHASNPRWLSPFAHATQHVRIVHKRSRNVVRLEKDVTPAERPIYADDMMRSGTRASAARTFRLRTYALSNHDTLHMLHTTFRCDARRDEFFCGRCGEMRASSSRTNPMHVQPTARAAAAACPTQHNITQLGDLRHFGAVASASIASGVAFRSIRNRLLKVSPYAVARKLCARMLFILPVPQVRQVFLHGSTGKFNVPARAMAAVDGSRVPLVGRFESICIPCTLIWRQRRAWTMKAGLTRMDR